jgi:hypothetical protein
VSYAQSSTLLNAHRRDGRVDYFYLCNGKHAETVKPPVAAIDHEVSFTRADRKAVPYRLDLWTGETEPVAVYKADGDTVTVRIALQPSEATVIILARGGHHPSATASQAEVRVDGQRLVARATAAGTYATTLADGRTVTTAIGAVPAAQTLTSWRLRVEDMTPDGTKSHDLALDALKAWPDIPELADVSGIGTYTTTVTLPQTWKQGTGARLGLGQVTDSFSLTVNGARIPSPNQLNATADIGSYLHAGRNTVTVRVSTTLINRLRTLSTALSGRSAQANGLVGPVTLTPYTTTGLD